MSEAVSTICSSPSPSSARCALSAAVISAVVPRALGMSPGALGQIGGDRPAGVERGLQRAGREIRDEQIHLGLDLVDVVEQAREYRAHRESGGRGLRATL